METKQSAVEWLFDMITQNGEIRWRGTRYRELFEQAKAMEKQQVINAANHGVDHENSPYENPEDYYNNIYGKV